MLIKVVNGVNGKYLRTDCDQTTRNNLDDPSDIFSLREAGENTGDTQRATFTGQEFLLPRKSITIDTMTSSLYSSQFNI